MAEIKKRFPLIKSGADCCGCTGCASACPKDAISMERNKAGFAYPKLEPDKCIGCLLCENVCGFEIQPISSINIFPKFYGARQKEFKEVMKSRSGGVFPLIARHILQNNGSVYGVILSESFVVKHTRITTITELDSLRGSKYVQSDLTGIFRSVKEDLQKGRHVLFSGTPCQTSTLLKYIPEKLQDKLFVIDIVCHGVPGATYWTEFLKFVEKKYKKKIERFIFRDKEKYNWLRHTEMVLFEGESEPIELSYRFYTDLLFRESCSSCPFTNLNRPSDLTLADFWGYERTQTHLNDDKKGLSLILVNTDKGAKMFDVIKPELSWFETTEEFALQPSLQHPIERNPNADKFYRAFTRHGFRYAMMRYSNVGLWATLRKYSNAVKRHLKRSL